MREVIIASGDAQQRLDKYLAKYLPDAPKSLIFKSLRKKNITLNGKKAEGNEKLAAGDCIRIFFAEETLEGFQKSLKKGPDKVHAVRDRSHGDSSAQKPSGFSICYEDDQILCINKPCGLLSQKAKPADLSLSELVADYVRKSSDSLTFRPGISNRLDRNTSGLVLAGKTHPAVIALDALILERQVKKEYLTIVKGVVSGPMHLSGWLSKDEQNNQVTVYRKKPEGNFDVDYIETAYIPLSENGRETLLLVELITGKSHQIRAHLASVGHPLAGDRKYGDAQWNKEFRQRYKLEHQLLHSWRVTFPRELAPALVKVAGKTIYAPLPRMFEKILAGEELELSVKKE